jgi:hypothetical protein
MPLVHAAIGGQFDRARFVHIALDAADARAVGAQHLGAAVPQQQTSDIRHQAIGIKIRIRERIRAKFRIRISKP